ncbi:MAG: YIP1 family protein [Phycisphaerae bacterium]
MSEPTADSLRNPLSLRHALLVYTAPRSLFARVEDTGRYGVALAVLLGLVVLIGYLRIQTGLIERAVDQSTEQRLATLETEQGHLLDRAELKTRMDDIRKAAAFDKTLAKLGAVVVTPVYFLASFLLIASVLYSAVALSGRKPEYHTLMSICVYAGFIELVGCAIALAMMVYYRTSDVDTSLGMLAPPGTLSFLSAIDPFRIWFWVLVGIGVCVTRQLSRRWSIITCSVMGLVAIGGRMALVAAANR